MVSANAMPQNIANASEAGADPHITIPFTPHSLLAALKAILTEPDFAAISRSPPIDAGA